VKRLFKLLFLYLFFSGIYFNSIAQTNYFVDGYHGGIYGHYPLYVTKLIVDTLNRYKDWKVNLEIEPESWDTIELKDPVGYAAIKKLINDSSYQTSIEYVNPGYAQSYLFNISVESIIRQFQYGMKKLRQHFPAITFTTYSSEEPCFTSALPQILKSLGIKYVSLKNPNTCWGGYTRAYGGEAVNWIGPDGTSILTVPRYASEVLQPKSTWQTIAWNNSKTFITAATQQGIQFPVGMCFQDAGWKNGPWLGKHKSSTRYTTWRSYFKLIENKKDLQSWRLSQEDIDVSLVWGSQILQRIAQEVRNAENKITMAEKIASMAKLYADIPYPEKEFDKAWRTLLLSQHHDCWIVPYNRHDGKTWAERVKEWTDYTLAVSDSIIHNSLHTLSNNNNVNDLTNIIAYNTTALNRNEIAELKLPKNTTGDVHVSNNGKEVPSQIIFNQDSSQSILFKASVPAIGYNSYKLSKRVNSRQGGAFIHQQQDGKFAMETDLYKIIIDPEHGGNIQHLIAKHLDNKDFVQPNKMNGFNALRGNFFNEGGLKTSSNSKAKITVLERGPLQIKIQIKNSIAGNKVVQTIQLKQGEKAIDCSLHIDYVKTVGIGEDYKQHGGYNSNNLHKAFYNDTNKLIATFPLNLQNQKVYKDAPLDVTESRLSNTFYNRWDSIKNNIIDNWVDVTDDENNYGMALLSDHVTSYSHGESFPLALTIQYVGVGLWGRNYSVSGPTDVHYALIPHKGKWDKANINNETIKWNEPVLTSFIHANNLSNAFIQKIDKGIAVTTMYYKGNDLYVRFVNNSSHLTPHHFVLNCYADELQFVELNDKINSIISLRKNQKVSFDCNIPLFGLKTIKVMNARR
jgi:alpha-mannosidase